MNTQSNLLKVLQKSALKTVLTYVASNKQFNSPLTSLAKVANISINGGGKSSKKLCFKCRRYFENILLFILHLELFHSDSISITKYQFEKDTLTIQFKDFHEFNSNPYIIQVAKGEIFLVIPLKERVKTILSRIFLKFSVKQLRSEREYFSAIDIFSRLSDQTSDNEEESIGSIERQLEKMRINEFSDVSESDKHFFLNWNDYMSRNKNLKGFNYVDNDTMREIAQEFCRKCKIQGIQRNNLLMHLWTLWSTGKIGPDAISLCLNIYDKSDSNYIEN